MFQRAALHQEPTYRVRGIWTDGFDSTVKSMRTPFRERAWATVCAMRSTSSRRKPTAIGSSVRKALRLTISDSLLVLSATAKSLRVFALGQRLRHFADHVAHTAGETNGNRVRQWFQDKKVGWYAVLEDPQMPGNQHPAGSGP